MSSSPRILFCECAYARIIPGDVKEQVLAALLSAGARFEAVPDLCELAGKRDPRLRDWAQAGDFRIAACFPRAVRGLFRAADAQLTGGTVVANMRTDNPEQILCALIGSAAHSTNAKHAIDARPTPGWLPWFPVIDYSRCTNCMQCMSFCLFDVFAVTPDRKISVQKPQNCKADCPACSRVCPEVAIMFPKYRSSPINGDEPSPDDIRREKVKVDISSLLGGDVYALLKNRSAKAQSRFSGERDESRALEERKKCLARLAEQFGVPASVLESLPPLPSGGRAAE